MPEKDIDLTAIDSFEFDEHLVLLKKNASRLQILNPLAKIIWQFKKNGKSNLKIATEISNAFTISVERALQDIKTIQRQWTVDLTTSPDKDIPNQTAVPLTKELNNWQATIAHYFSFPGCNVKVNFDSQTVASKVKKLFPFAKELKTYQTDIQLNIISSLDTYLIVKDDLILEQTKTEGYTAQIIFQYIIDSACKQNDWLAILHAGGVSWQGHGIIFPARGGSGKTTLTAALIKQGFDYINDDVIPLIRKTGELIHLPSCLRIKTGSWPLLQPFYPEIQLLEVFGSQEPKVKYLPPPLKNKLFPTLYAKHIILPNYQEGVTTAKLEPISPVLALEAIIAGESLLHLPLKKNDISALLKWLEPIACHRLNYDKLEPATALLRQFCMDNIKN